MENPESKFKELYKSKQTNYQHQEERRIHLLKIHKLQRSLVQDATRNLEKILTKANKYTAKTNQRNLRTFRNKYQTNHRLQLSEWLREKPENMNDWFLVPCPKGQRCMVIACNGYTEVYDKRGLFFDTFQSLLPGDAGHRNDVTILDCIYVASKSTFYVLDALAYGNQDLLNCEAEFRFFWLKSKFVENDFDEISLLNVYAFKCLEFYDFENTTMVSMGLQEYPLWEDNCPELDGFLFYHKKASYTCGTTPLVGWLFAFMVPEVLGVAVSGSYLEQKPDDYIDYIHHIVEFDENLAKKKQKYKQRRRTQTVTMDEDASSEEGRCDDDNDTLSAVLNAERDLELEGETFDLEGT